MLKTTRSPGRFFSCSHCAKRKTAAVTKYQNEFCCFVTLRVILEGEAVLERCDRIESWATFALSGSGIHPFQLEGADRFIIQEYSQVFIVFPKAAVVVYIRS